MLQGFFTSLLYLMTKSLSGVEAISYYISQLSFKNILESSVSLGLMPLYYLSLHQWVGLMGKSEILLRSFSMVWFGIFIITMHHILMEVFFQSEKKGYRSLLFFVFNPALFYFAFQIQEAMMFLGLTTLSFYFLAKKKYGLFMGFGILATLTSISFLGVHIIQAIYMSKESNLTKRKFTLFSMPIVLLSVVLMGIIFRNSSPALVAQQLASSVMVLGATGLSLYASYRLTNYSRYLKGLVVACSVFICFGVAAFFRSNTSFDFKKTINSVSVVLAKDDIIYVKDPTLYYLSSYYFADRVYYFGAPKNQPYLVNLIPRRRFTKMLPAYPQKAFMIDTSGNFEALSSY